MKNDAPAPFPNGEAKNMVDTVMEFRVELPLSSIDTSVIPSYLRTFRKLNEQSAAIKRKLTLDHRLDQYGREIMLLDNKGWDAPITENPTLGSTEIWYLINLTEDSHPIHLHLIHFQILDRRDFDVDEYERKSD